MRSADIRAYANRRWDLVEALKEQFWAREKQRMSASDSMRLADDLRRYVLWVQPGGASDLERDDDLRSHAAVAEKLRLARPHRNR